MTSNQIKWVVIVTEKYATNKEEKVNQAYQMVIPQKPKKMRDRSDAEEVDSDICQSIKG